MLAFEPLQGVGLVGAVVLRSRLGNEIGEPARVALPEHGSSALLDETLGAKLPHRLQQSVAELVGAARLG